MKKDIIFLGWNIWEFISMKKNVEFKNIFQIDNNWTHHRKLLYTMECTKLLKGGNVMLINCKIDVKI